MPWTQPEATERLTPHEGLPGLSPDDWIEIKTNNTATLRQKLFRASMHTSVDGEAAVKADLDIFAYRQALLENIVVAWSDPEAPTPARLAALHPEIQDWISAEFDRLSGGMKSSAEMGEASTPSTSTSTV